MDNLNGELADDKAIRELVEKFLEKKKEFQRKQDEREAVIAFILKDINESSQEVIGKRNQIILDQLLEAKAENEEKLRFEEEIIKKRMNLLDAMAKVNGELPAGHPFEKDFIQMLAEVLAKEEKERDQNKEKLEKAEAMLASI